MNPYDTNLWTHPSLLCVMQLPRVHFCNLLMLFWLAVGYSGRPCWLGTVTAEICTAFKNAVTLYKAVVVKSSSWSHCYSPVLHTQLAEDLAFVLTVN